MAEKSHSEHPNTNRVDALTDGVFAIAATLLVIEINLPNIPAQHTQQQLMDSLFEVLPSFIAFAISFFTILIYWINHDGISKATKFYNHRASWLNIIMLFFIVIIPFPTKFIAEYPMELVAVVTYGVTMMLLGVSANLLFWYIAFRAKLLDGRISVKARRSIMKKFLSGPSLYLVATALAFVNVHISIAIFIIVPILFFIPINQENLLKELRVE